MYILGMTLGKNEPIAYFPALDNSAAKLLKDERIFQKIVRQIGSDEKSTIREIELIIS
jgi:hypothetical protein